MAREMLKGLTGARALGSFWSSLACWAVLVLPACRIAKPETRWVEAHGAAEMRQIAASPRGVDAITISTTVRHYPGVYGDPWPTTWAGSATSLAASLDSTFALTQQGAIVRIHSRSASIWRDSTTPALASIHSGLTSDLFGVTAAGQPLRVQKDSEQPLLCSGPAKAIVAVGADVYVLNQDGSVDRDASGRCERLTLPKAADAIAASAGALYFVSAGTVFEKRGDRISELPAPEIFRTAGYRKTSVTAISASERTLWAMSSEGYVFQLVRP